MTNSETDRPAGRDLPALLALPESESFDRKSALDPTKPDDLLGLVADLTAMANTNGGAVLIGESGTVIPKEHLPLFDSARLDDKVNSFVEPRVSGIKSTVLAPEFVLVEVENSHNPPHVFKREGNYHDAQGKQRAMFRVGDVFARHSSKTERANRSDFDRWFEKNRSRLFENVRMVFEAGPAAHVQVTEHEGPPVRIDPTAPDAQPVYDVLTPNPFRDLEQELVGGIKAWKTSGQYLNENQILKAYAQRDKISDPEVLELILRSCWEHRLPGYYWAARMPPPRLFTVLEEMVTADRYPASGEAIKVAALLPRAWGKALVMNAKSSRTTVQRLRRKLEAVLRARTRKHVALLNALYPHIKTFKYKATEGAKEVKIEAIGEQLFEELLGTLPKDIRENRGPFRLSELLTYGAALQEVQVGDTGGPEESPENGPEVE